MARERKEISDADIVKIKGLAAIGLNLEQIAGNLGMCRKTLWDRSKDDPRIEIAVRDGQAAAAATVANALFEEAKTGKNMTATIFWLKTRLGWREKSEVDVTVKPNVRFKTTIQYDGTLVQQILQEDGIIEAPTIEGETVQP